MKNQNRLFRKKYHFLENSFSKFRPAILSRSNLVSPGSSVLTVDPSNGMEKVFENKNRIFAEGRENPKYNYDTKYKNLNFQMVKEEAFFSKSTPNSVKNSSLPYYIQYNLLNLPETSSAQKFIPYAQQNQKEFRFFQQFHSFFPQKKSFFNEWIFPFLGFVGFASMNPRFDSYLNFNVHNILFPLSQKVLPILEKESQNEVVLFQHDNHKAPFRDSHPKKTRKNFQFIKAKNRNSKAYLGTQSPQKNPKNPFETFHLTPLKPFQIDNDSLSKRMKGPVDFESKEIFSKFHLNRSFYNSLLLKGEDKIPKKLQKNQILLKTSSKTSEFPLFKNETSPIHSYHIAKTWVDEIVQKEMFQLENSKIQQPFLNAQNESSWFWTNEKNEPIFVFTKSRKLDNKNRSWEEFGFSTPKEQMFLPEKKGEEDENILEKSKLLKILNTEFRNNSMFNGDSKVERTQNHQNLKLSHQPLKDVTDSWNESPQKRIEFLKKEISGSLRKLYLKKSLFEKTQKENQPTPFGDLFQSKNQNFVVSSSFFDQKEKKDSKKELSGAFKTMSLPNNPFLDSQKIFHSMKILQKIENHEKFQFLFRFSAPTQKHSHFENRENQAMSSFLVFENQKEEKNENLQRYQKMKWMAYRLLVLRYFKASIDEKLIARNLLNLSFSHEKKMRFNKTFVPKIQKKHKTDILEIQKESKTVTSFIEKSVSEKLQRTPIFQMHTPLLMQEKVFSKEIPSYNWGAQEEFEQKLKSNVLGQEKTFLRNEENFQTSFSSMASRVETTKLSKFKPLMFHSSQDFPFLVSFSNLLNKVSDTMCLFLGKNQSYLLKNHDILSSPFLSTSSLSLSPESFKPEKKENKKNFEKIFRAYLSCKSNQTSMKHFQESFMNPGLNFMDENSLEFMKKLNLSPSNDVNANFLDKQEIANFQEKEGSLFHTKTKTLSPNKMLKRFGFLFLNKNEMESTNSFFKQKYQQKKRRRKKLKLENRRRKKRKRFYPRPVWLRLNLYKSFYTKRFLRKNPQNFALLKDSKLQKPKSVFERKKNKAIDQTSLAVLNHHSQYQISTTVMSDFQRLCWKSYWLRSNLTPYIQRVQTKLQKMREVQSATEKKSFLQQTLSHLVGFRSFVSSEKTFSSLNSQQSRAYLKDSSKNEIQKNVEFSKNLRNIAEYDRILYDRISEILQNVKTNLNGNGQNHARSFKRGYFSKTLTTNSPLQTSSQRDPEFQSKKKKKGIFEKMETFINPEMDGFSFFDQKTKPYGDLPTLRALWALNQTNVLKSPGGTKFSKTKHLWATFKVREQNKANKTKKFLTKIQNSAKMQAFNLSSFSNSNVSLSSKLPYAFHSRQNFKETSEEQKQKEIENKSLYFAKTKFNTIENKLQYLGLSVPSLPFTNRSSDTFSPSSFSKMKDFQTLKNPKDLYYSQKKEKNEIYHLENSNYKNILKQLKFQLKSKNHPFWAAKNYQMDGEKGIVEKEEPRKQFSSRIQFWWLTNQSNPNLFLNLKDPNEYFLFPLSGTQVDSTVFSIQLGLVESCSILFHIFCLFCFLRISEIRSFFKFFVLVFYKLSNSYLAITYSIYNLLIKYQKQTEETFIIIRQNTLPYSPFSSMVSKAENFKNVEPKEETEMERNNGRASYAFLFSQKNWMDPKKGLNVQKQTLASFPFKNQSQKEKFLNLEFLGTNQKPSTFFEFSFYFPPVSTLERAKTRKIFSENGKVSSWPFILGEQSESVFLLKSSQFIQSGMNFAFNNSKTLNFKENEQKTASKPNSPIVSLALKAYTYFILTSLNLRKISVQSFSKIVLIFYFGLRIILDIVESFMLIIYKFLEKPAEFMVEWIAELFLVEWSSDVRTFVPESFDIYTWSSFKKLTRGSFVLGPAGFLIQRRLWYFMEIFMNLCKKPDSDLNARQKKGILFWDIWAEILTEAAKKYQVNLQSLTTNSTEQDSFLEKLFNDPFLFETPYSSSLYKSGENSKMTKKLASLFPNPRNGPFSPNENGIETQLFRQNALSRLNPNEYRWSANQYFTGRELDTDLFVDIHPPKSLNHISTTIRLSGYQSLGQIVQQIYSGIFEKQIAKNLLIIGERGSGKSLLVQALAGETSIRLITDNAHRYAMNIKGVAVGMKLLRDVFDALALQTPCLFLMEDIHKIGERRPMLISDDENASLFEKTNSLRLTTGSEEVHEKNQLIYQLSKHSISNYKRPYKGDFSFLIPTNHFCFDLFLGKSPPKTRKNLTSPKNALFANLRNSTLNTEIENESLKTSFGNQKEIFMSHLMIPSTTGFAPPATSPFTILGMKEQQKFQVRKLVQEMPWGGFSTDQLMLVKLSAYSIRVKVALLADMAMNKLLTKLDMITDLLVIMDNVRTNQGFVVFATTHVPFVLDPALRRPGRFDETIKVVSKSNFLNRYEIFKANLSHYSSTVDFLDYSLLFENSIGSLQANTGEINSQDFIQKTKLLLMSNYSTLNQPNQNKSTETIFQPNFNNTSLNQAIRLSSLSLFMDSTNDSMNVNNQMFKFFYPYKRKNNFTESNSEALDLSNETKYVFSNFSILSLAYSRISKFLIQSQFLKDNRAFRLMFSIPYGEKLENQKSAGGEEFIFRDFYSKNYEIQHQLMFLFSGKVGEFFVLNNFQNPQTSFSSGQQNFPLGKSNFANFQAQNQVNSIEMDSFWRSAMTFVFSLIQKRFLYQKNRMATQLLDFSDKEIHMEPPSPPVSKILMPTKKYENFKRVEKDFQQKPLFKIQQKIQLHQQQRFMKSLYQNQISSYRQKNSSISEITKELAYIENSLNKPSSVNCYYKSRILNRHRFSRMNQWWNAQLAEHNVETSRLSDVDWRSMFSESFGDLTIDYPDAEQYYNPKYRRWFLQSSYGGYWLSFQKTILFEIYQHFMILCYNRVSNYLETERELLDYFASMYLQKATFQEIDFISTLSRFSSNPSSTQKS